ncbi:MAG: methyltransferase domain-containing protein [Bradymonadales bacterium]|nr:methyltransferase domain-containing protein [Bradymonadales bacterium]
MELEPFGVDYERYALGKLLRKLARTLPLKSCLELPARGAKAMPSLYSLGLAQGGAQVTLVNPADSAVDSWTRAGLVDRLTISRQESLARTTFPDSTFDWVWNFAYLPTDPDPAALVREMRRISRRYVAIFSVNGWNVGAFVHRALHRILQIPWTHGDVALNFRGPLARLMKDCGLKIAKAGMVDCPFWPDSLGFRDVRLHRQGVVEMDTEWSSNTLGWVKEDRYPAWIHSVYAFESIPTPAAVKLLYAHLFYLVGEKR